MAKMRMLLLVVSVLFCLGSSTVAAQNWVTMSDTPMTTYQIDKDTVTFSGSEADRQVEVWMKMILKNENGKTIVGHYLVREKDLSFLLKERIFYAASGTKEAEVDATQSGWKPTNEKSPIGFIAKKLFAEYQEPKKVASFDVGSMKTYENKRYNFQINYPDGWKIKEQETEMPVSFVGEVTGAKESGVMLVYVKETPSFVPVSVLEQLAADANKIPKGWQTYKNIKVDNFKISGAPAKIHIFTGSKNNKQYASMIVYAVSKNRFYMFDFIVNEDVYYQYEPVIMEMMKSINISSYISM